ncbi:MAG: hypothetical protein WDN72_07735 [Alphaproteobacteria bacterium]
MGYLIEKSLSLDNLFVFLLIFTHFGVPREYQHRVLFWGILGALLLRGAMIGTGTVLIAHFEWVTYIFGAFLVLTAAGCCSRSRRSRTSRPTASSASCAGGCG